MIADAVELAASAARHRDDVEVWQDGLHAAPFVPRFEAVL